MTHPACETALALIEDRMPELSDWCATIFDFGETAWREYRSAEWYVARLRAEGFTVEEGSAGMPTAFCAEWRNPDAPDGPMLGLYAEYDGIPGNCQAALPYRAPREGLGYQAGGHTDPHSGLGIGAFGGALAIKAAMAAHGIPGGIRFTGEPAEKVRGSKPIHAAAGYYDGLAAVLSFHPFYMMPMCNTVRWDTQCGAGWSMIYRFICDAPQEWGRAGADGAPIPQAHSAVRAPGASEALMMMYQAGKALRDAWASHAGGWSISEAVLTAGQATADNQPAGLAELQYMMRTPTIEMAEQITAGLDRNAEAIAAMTGCRWERHWVCKSRPGLTNHVMANVVWDALQQAGAPKWGDEARAIMRQVQEAAGMAPMADPLIPECESLIAPQDAEAILRRDLPPSQANSTSDDYTDMSWHAPLARFYIARPALRGGPYPPWVMNALGGIPETIDPMVRTAARVVALAGLRVLTDAGARQAAWDEFAARKAENYIPPLCDYPPPINFRWPEYVTTPRGRDWWIPALMPEA